MRCWCFWAAAVVAGGLAANLYAAGPPADRSLPVICPAIDQDERPRTSDPAEPQRAVELVVAGSARSVDDPAPGDHLFEITVTRELYGKAPPGPLRFVYPSAAVMAQGIYALAPPVSPTKAPWRLKYAMDGSELAAAQALAAARLDYRALSARDIIIAKGLAGGDPAARPAELVAVLAGQPLAPGAPLNIGAEFITMFHNGNDIPPLPPDDHIYFIHSVSSTGTQHIRTLYMSTLLPAACRPQVVQALARRDQYPIVESDDSPGARAREVMFTGSVADAIDLLGSSNDAAVTLAAHMLAYQRKTSADAVVSAINKDLLRQEPVGPAAFRRLHQLIVLLGVMQDHHVAGPIAALLDRYINYAASGPAPPQTMPPESRAAPWKNEAEQEDVNHTLAWLCASADEQEILTLYGPRLVQLRNSLQGLWKDEVQLALDACRLEDNMELDPARDNPVRHQRVEGAMAPRGDCLAFSPDGQFLAVGAKVWRIADWSLAATLPLERAHLQALVFTPDSSGLYACGIDGQTPLLACYDWRTGKLQKSLEGHEAEITWAALAANGHILATVSNPERVLNVWDTAAGAIVKSLDLPGDRIAVALSPDGTLLAHQVTNTRIVIEPVGGEITRPLNVLGYRTDRVLFSADQKSLLTVTHQTPDHLELTLYDVAGGFSQQFHQTLAAGDCTDAIVSPDGKYLAVADKDGRIWLLTVPDLSVVKNLQVRRFGSVEPGQMSFSPDSQLLAVAAGADPLVLLNVPSLQRLLPGPGHGDTVTGLFFTDEGRSLRSVGRDNMLCLWDVASMKMLRRNPLPDDSAMAGASDPDGRYLLCPRVAALNRPPVDAGSDAALVQTIDANTVSVVAAFHLAADWSSPDTACLWLPDNQTLLLGSGRWCRFDYLAGKILDDHPTPLGGSNTFLAEDGKTLWTLSGGGASIAVAATDWTTGNSRPLGRIPIPRSTGQSRGLVPGGRWLFLADPGLYIYDRLSLQSVMEKSFIGSDVLDVRFSHDGSRCAVLTRPRGVSSSPTTVRILSTRTGATLLAFPAPARWVPAMAFSPDDRRLAIAGDAGVIEMWRLPSAVP